MSSMLKNGYIALAMASLPAGIFNAEIERFNSNIRGILMFKMVLLC